MIMMERFRTKGLTADTSQTFLSFRNQPGAGCIKKLLKLTTYFVRIHYLTTKQ